VVGVEVRGHGERVVTINEVLDGHNVLDISCLDRLYLSAFVQKLQTPGGVVFFLHQHRGMPIASPAVFEQIGARFRDGMRRLPRPITSRWCGLGARTARSR
jgi:hypothetical protein